MADSKLMKLNPHVAGKLAKQVMEDMQKAAPVGASRRPMSEPRT